MKQKKAGMATLNGMANQGASFHAGLCWYGSSVLSFLDHFGS